VFSELNTFPHPTVSSVLDISGHNRLDHSPRKRERLEFVGRHKYQIEVGEVVGHPWLKYHILGNTLHTHASTSSSSEWSYQQISIGVMALCAVFCKQ
jgi:hypothetical protein